MSSGSGEHNRSPKMLTHGPAGSIFLMVSPVIEHGKPPHEPYIAAIAFLKILHNPPRRAFINDINPIKVHWWLDQMLQRAAQPSCHFLSDKRFLFTAGQNHGGQNASHRSPQDVFTSTVFDFLLVIQGKRKLD